MKYRAPLELDVAIWFDDDGDQVQKWTTKVQITGRAKHRSFQHFRDLMAGNLWRVRDHRELPAFTIEPLRAPTTSELGVFFALAPESNTPPATTPALRLAGDVEPNAARPPEHLARREFFGVNVRPESVVDPIVPPGYGFAILATDGKVLFHSQEGLSLEENFFEEVGDPADVRAKAQARRPVQWSGDYHGRPHRIRMDTLGNFDGCPWLIVAFQEM